MKPQVSLKARALRFLSMREHSRVELARKLQAYVAESDDLEALLDSLEAQRYLSNQRFSESLAHRRRARFGNQRIFAELQQHQLSDSELGELKQSLRANEGQRATEVLHKKFHHPPIDHLERAKQMRFLAQRGFSSSAIETAMRAERLDYDGNCDTTT